MTLSLAFAVSGDRTYLPLDAIFVLTSSERNIELGESMSSAVQELRTIVQEGIRVQRGGADPVDYIDAANAVRDAIARQNHVIFWKARLR